MDYNTNPLAGKTLICVLSVLYTVVICLETLVSVCSASSNFLIIVIFIVLRITTWSSKISRIPKTLRVFQILRACSFHRIPAKSSKTS